jgi:predicted restriction endonuclease
MLAFSKKAEVTISQLRKHAREAMRFRARFCAHYSYSDYVEVCHIKAVASFRDEARLLEINDSSNLVFLCPNFHKQLDRGRLVPNPSWAKYYDEEDDFDAVL